MPLSKRGRCVYTIVDRESKAFKIGISNSPKTRLAELQVGNPHKLELIEIIEKATIKEERKLQQQYESSRISGEWFRLYDDGSDFLVLQKDGSSHCVNITGGVRRVKFVIPPNESLNCVMAFDNYGKMLGWCR